MVLAWKVEEREGRGFCLVANKSLVPGWSMVNAMVGIVVTVLMLIITLSLTDHYSGELILAEKPLFTVPAEEHNSDLDQYLENALEVIMMTMLMLMLIQLMMILAGIETESVGR